MRTQVGLLKISADQPVGISAHHHRIRFGGGLNPGGQVRRLPDDGLRFECFCLVHIADDDQTGVDADPDAYGNPGLTLEFLADPLNGLGDAETGLDGPARVIFVGHGIAEVGQNAVAKIFGEITVVQANDT